MDSSLYKKQKPKEVPIVRFLKPFREFIKIQASSGIILMICTIIALIWANSFFKKEYLELLDLTFTFGIESFNLTKSLHLWINDGIMAIFFFVVGLEIKREILVGELSKPEKAILPVIAALGGMIFPALIYSLVNINNPENMRGWGIPMATDIAFVVGIMTLLGDKIPLSLKIFVTSLAIVDDIGAVLVIAVFYSSKLHYFFLMGAFLVFIILIVMNRFGVQNPVVYGLIGIILWIFIFESGVHATITGVLLAITIPARNRINVKEFINTGQLFIRRFQEASETQTETILNRRQLRALQSLEYACQSVETPLQRFERGLNSWVAFVIMPVFVITNAGVSLESIDLFSIINPVTLGISLGLIFGKQLGIFIFTWLSVKIGLTSLPKDVTWHQIYGVSWLAGIGFTMSLFIASLALINPTRIAYAKIGILCGSIIAGCIGFIILSKSKSI